MLAGEPAPVCPVFAHQHHPAADQDGERLAEATVAWQARFDFDLVKLTPASTWQIRDYGVEDAPDPDDALGRRRITRRVVTVPEDWLHLPRLDPGRGFAAEILRAAALVRRALPGMPVVATVYSPAAQAAKLAEPDRLADHVREAPEAVAAGLRTITENTVRLIGALADTGIDGVFLAVQNARAAAFTAAAYAGFGLPGDRASLEAARELPFNILHLHGDGVHHALFQDRLPALLHLEASPGQSRTRGPAGGRRSCHRPVTLGRHQHRQRHGGLRGSRGAAGALEGTPVRAGPRLHAADFHSRGQYRRSGHRRPDGAAGSAGVGVVAEEPGVANFLGFRQRGAPMRPHCEMRSEFRCILIIIKSL